MIKDHEHEIVIRFDDGAFLHRFRNEGNVPYSAIYYGCNERTSLVQVKEEQLVRRWREEISIIHLKEQMEGIYPDWSNWNNGQAFKATALMLGEPYIDPNLLSENADIYENAVMTEFTRLTRTMSPRILHEFMQDVWGRYLIRKYEMLKSSKKR